MDTTRPGETSRAGLARFAGARDTKVMNLLYANDRTGVHAPSWYAATAAPAPDRPALKGDRRADVAIIGAGYTGLSAALHLAEAGFDVALMDAHRVGWGASGRNGGQLGTGQRVEQEELEKMVGAGDARRLWDLAEEAKATVRDLIARHAIDCDLKPGVIHTIHRARYFDDLKAEAEHLATHYDYPTEVLDRDALRAIVDSPAYFGGSVDPGASHLHPLNYALGLANAAEAAGATIYERSEITKSHTTGAPIVETADGRITADHVILACNGYLGDLSPPVAARVMPINNFILATEPLEESVAQRVIANGMAVADSKFVVNYYRLSPDRRLLFGGQESYGYRFPSDIKGFVRKAMLSIYPYLKDTRIDYGWGGTLAITMSRLPHLARIAPNVLSVSGYSGHGVAIATLSGKIAAEAIRGQSEQFDLMSSLPTPRFPGGPSFRSPLLALAMAWYSLRDRL